MCTRCTLYRIETCLENHSLNAVSKIEPIGGSSRCSGRATSASASATSSTSRSTVTAEIDQRGAGEGAGGVIVVLPRRLEKIHRNTGKACKILPREQRTNDQSKEDNEHDEVEDGETDDTSLTQLRLLE